MSVMTGYMILRLFVQNVMISAMQGVLYHVMELINVLAVVELTIN